MSLTLREDSPLARVLRAYSDSPASGAMMDALADPVRPTASNTTQGGVVSPVTDDIDFSKYIKPATATPATATPATATSSRAELKKAINTTRRLNDISLVHTNLQKFYAELKQRTKEMGFRDIPKVGESLRSKKRQMYLWSLGRTRKGKVVTWTRNSRHMHGIAIDIAPPRDIYKSNGKKDYAKENKFLHMAWELGKKYGVGGIKNRSKDPYHFQLDWGHKLL